MICWVEQRFLKAQGLFLEKRKGANSSKVDFTRSILGDICGEYSHLPQAH